jgi:SAM-dependent methyltransferase
MATIDTLAPGLKGWIDEQPLALGTEWLAGQEARKKEEAEFHDAYREGHRDEESGTSSNHRFYEAATVVNEYVERWINRWAPAGSGTFLDYACGHGTQTLRAARAGAQLAVGIDISETSVRNAKENAIQAGLGDHTRFLQRDCEATGLPAGSFSACLCSGMLHHLDLTRAYPELARLMAPGGRILCVEALSYNPVIQLYRDRTPELRTSWEKEHILGMKEVRLARQWFDVENVKFFLMAAPLAALLPAGAPRRLAMKAGHLVDSIATRIPGLQLWSWQFAFELVKRKD